jgi:hypothetical protein
MASTYWVKLYIEILDDPKMGVMNDRIWRRAIECLLLAKEYGNDGTLPPIDQMAWRLRLPEKELKDEVEELMEVRFLEQSKNGNLVVKSFAERQGPLTATQRARAHRSGTPFKYREEEEDSKNKRKTKRNLKATKRSTHPSIGAFRSATHRFPPKSWYADIEAAVGDDDKEIERWFEVAKEWTGRGWNPVNVKGMLEKFVKEKPKHIDKDAAKARVREGKARRDAKLKAKGK